MAVTIDRLEPRIFLSQTPASPRPDTLGAPFDKGERQVLLDRLTAIPSGTRTTLQGHLNSNSVGSFDSLLRSHFQARVGTNFFFASANAGSIASYITGTLGDSDASVRSNKIVDDRLFPQDTSTGDFTVSLPADINWQNPGVSPSPDFIHALHRFQYWNDLVLTYLDTGTSKYVNELMYQLADWHNEMQVITAPPAATNDTAGWQLDTSIRTENFVWTYFSLLNEAGWTNASNSLLLYKIVQHGDFLYSEAATNLDTASNRTLTLAKGLHYLGVLFPEVNNSADWAVAGRNLLFASMDGQFYDDGGHVEQSPGYTVNAIEDLLESKHLDALNGTSWPGARSTKLSNAVTSYWQMLSLDGSRPAISDTYRNTSVTLFLKANEIQGVTTWPEAKPRPRDAWLFGTAFSNSKLGNPVTPAMGNRGDTYAMNDAGYYVMRSGNTTSDRQIIFDIGPKGGIHGHFDTLNFELWGGGRPLIKDPGPFKYDNSADRSYVISTRAHNTINIAGNNIGELEGASNPGLQVSQWAVTGSSAQITATHRGYQYLAGRPVVTRSMWYDLDGTIVIVDFVESNTSYLTQQSFNLPADVAANPTGVQPDGSFRTRFNTGGNVKIAPIDRPGQSVSRNALTFTTDLATGDYKEDAYRYTVTQTGTFLVFATLITSYNGTTVPDTSATLLTANPTPGGVVQVQLNKGGSLSTLNFQQPAMERLDTAGTSRGTDNDIIYDSTGRLHQVWFDRDTRNLKYATRETNGVWTIAQVIDNNLDAGLYPSIDIAPNGTVGVAYFDGQNGDLKYAHLSRIYNSWQTQTVDSVGSVGLYPSLKFSRNSGAVIAYYNRTKGQLRLAITQTAGFQISILDGTAANTDVGRFASLQLDPNRPNASKWAIVYEDTRNGKYKYTIEQGTGWSTSVIDTSLQLAGGYASLAFYDTNSTDPTIRYRPAASYYDAGDTALKYSYFNGSTWVPQTVAAAKIQGLYTNLFFTGAAGNQKPNIYYYDRSNNLAKRAVGASVGGSWNYTVLGDGGRAMRIGRFGANVAWTNLDESVGTLTTVII